MIPEIAVLGGGPAGAVAAARLAALGHRVVLIERTPFPRPHIGESLSPGVWPLLAAVHVSPDDVAAVARACPEAVIAWRVAAERVAVPDSVTVDRAGFDAVLLDRARGAGVTVLTAGAARPSRTADGWRIAAGQHVLHAAVVVDASGRRRLLGGRRTWTAPRTVAVHARWSAHPEDDGTHMLVDTVPQGWLWAARLPHGTVRVMAFVDPPTLRANAVDPGRLVGALVASSPVVSRWLAGCPLPREVAVCEASSYVVDDPIGPGHVRVGEAAFAIDPLSSCGVQVAVQSGLAAAAAVHTMRTAGGDAGAAQEYYAEFQRATVAHHRATAAWYYAAHRRYAAQPFWRRRSIAAHEPAPEPASTAAADLLGHPVRLRAPAVLRESACLVGDVVVRRVALHHPDLDRPVAFLGGAELGPLLRDLPGAPSLAAAVRRWDQVLPAGDGARIARWLMRRDLLERAD